MAIDINLVIDNENKSPQSEKVKKVTTISFAILFFTAFFSFMIFLINLRFSANSVRQNQQEISNALSVYDDQAAKILIFNNRMSDISAIILTRNDYTPLLDHLVQKRTEDIIIENLRLEPTAFDMTVSSRSLLSLNEYLNQILAFNSPKMSLSNVVLKTLTVSQGGFTLSLSAEIL